MYLRRKFFNDRSFRLYIHLGYDTSPLRLRVGYPTTKGFFLWLPSQLSELIRLCLRLLPLGPPHSKQVSVALWWVSQHSPTICTKSHFSFFLPLRYKLENLTFGIFWKFTIRLYRKDSLGPLPTVSHTPLFRNVPLLYAHTFIYMFLLSYTRYLIQILRLFVHSYSLLLPCTFTRFSSFTTRRLSWPSVGPGPVPSRYLVSRLEYLPFSTINLYIRNLQFTKMNANGK